MMKLAVGFAVSLLIASVLVAAPVIDPYGSLTLDEKTVLKPQIERWIQDQVKHNWTDLWEIQDQTSDLKSELLLGRRDAPDMDRNQYVQAMRETIGVGYPEIKAFTLREVRREDGGYWILGCGRLHREAWKQTSMTHVHVRLVKGKVTFDLPGATPDPCKL